MTGECMSALYAFFSGFGIPAYGEGEVPLYDESGREIRPPYITVQLIAPDWRGARPFYARLWYRSRTYAEINAKADEIAEAIGEGASVTTAHGCVVINRDDNFLQYQPQAGDETLKCAYLSMVLQNCTG